MIHTMTIFHELSEGAAKRILSLMGHDPAKLEGCGPWTEPHPASGIDEVSVSKQQRGTRYHGILLNAYYIFIRLEPLTLTTGEKHIRLFRCSPENVKKLQDAFRSFMVTYLDLDGTPSSLNDLAEFSTWDAQRVDYTRDIRMRNHDEVLAMMNIFKMSALTNGRRNAINDLSTYDDHFYDTTFKVGNDTWEIEGYDKQAQVEQKKDLYAENDAEDIYHELVGEAQSMLRLEYRRKTSGTKKDSTHFEDRNIMPFLSEELATEWLMDAYGSIVGFEPFYVLYYQLQLKIAGAFPMSDREAKHETARKNRYDKQKKAADKAGRKIPHYGKQLFGRTAQQYWDFMSFVVRHKGLQNARNHFAEFHCDSHRSFDTFLKNIREKIGVSPVAIPDNWRRLRPNGNGRGMDLPSDYIPNPIQRPKPGEPGWKCRKHRVS